MNWLCRAAESAFPTGISTGMTIPVLMERPFRQMVKQNLKYRHRIGLILPLVMLHRFWRSGAAGIGYFLSQ